MSGNSPAAAAARAEAAPRRAAWLALSACVASIALLAMQALAAKRLELTFDEAYYTLWSRSLSFGYLDHPPMVALLIHVSTALFGGRRIRGAGAFAPSGWRAACADRAHRVAPVWFGGEGGACGADVDRHAARRHRGFVRHPRCAAGRILDPWSCGPGRALAHGPKALAARDGPRAWPCAAIEVHRRLFRKRRRARPDRDALAAPLARVARALAGLAVALAIFAPFAVWNAEHGWATFAKQLGRAPPHGFTPYYLAEFLVAQIGLINPLVFAALIPAVAAIPWRAPVAARSPGEARRILACTIAPAAVYFLLHSLHDRVQGNWLAPLYPAAAILVADWVAEVRRAGAAGFAGAIAKAAPWAAPIGIAVAALTFAETMTGAVPLGPANPLARLEGFRTLARDSTPRRTPTTRLTSSPRATR